MTRTVPAMLSDDAAAALKLMLPPATIIWTVATYSPKLRRSVKMLVVDPGSGELRNISAWVASTMDLTLDARHGGVALPPLSRYRRAEDLLTALSYRLLGKGDQFGHRWI